MNISNGVKRWEVTAFVRPCWTKTENMKGSNKRKSFVGMNDSNSLKMRRFSCLWRLSGYHQKWVIWHKFYIGNRVVSNIKMSRNRQACSLRNEGVQAFIHRQDFIHCHSSSRCMASKLWSFSSINAPFFHVHHYINSLGRTCVDPRHLCI